MWLLRKRVCVTWTAKRRAQGLTAGEHGHSDPVFSFMFKTFTHTSLTPPVPLAARKLKTRVKQNRPPVSRAELKLDTPLVGVLATPASILKLECLKLRNL